MKTKPPPLREERESEGDEEHEHAEEMRLLARLVMEWIVQVLEKCMYVLCMRV